MGLRFCSYYRTTQTLNIADNLEYSIILLNGNVLQLLK